MSGREASSSAPGRGASGPAGVGCPGGEGPPADHAPGSGRLLLFVAICAVSTAAPLVRLAGDVHWATLAMWRLLIAGSVLALVTRPRGLIVVRAWGAGSIAGVLLGLHFAAWFASLALTSVAASTTLVTTAPLFAAMIAPRWLGDATPPRLWTGALVALAGVALIAQADAAPGEGLFSGAGAASLLGDGLALLAALAGSVYLLIGRRVRAQVAVEAQIVMTCLAGAAALALTVAIVDAPFLLPTRAAWLAVVVMALGPHLAGHGLLNVAVRRRPAQEVQLALLGEPILSTLIAMALLGEFPPLFVYPGMALVIAGLALGLGRMRRGRGDAVAP